MDFGLSPDQQLLRGTARAFLDEHATAAAVRALWDDPRGERDDLWKELGRLGWLGLALPEAHGGSALGMVETAIVLEELGRVAFPGPYLETVVAAQGIQTAGSPAQQARWLPAIAGGAREPPWRSSTPSWTGARRRPRHAPSPIPAGCGSPA